MLQFFILCVSFFIHDVLTEGCEAENKYSWSYHGPQNGPDHWKDKYPDCGNKDQSPIEIRSMDNLIVNLNLPKLKYYGFNSPITKATVQNVGWTVVVTPGDRVHRYINWGDVIYTVSEIHLHFGSESDPGADHVFEGSRYSMEVHYVTHEDKNKNKMAVVASFMKATDDHNSGLDAIIEVLPAVRYRGESTELKSHLNLAGLLPQDSGSYYCYMGSNSIPPCEPGYIWWILKDVKDVGNSQLDQFLTLSSVGRNDESDSCLMGPNYRPVQNLNHRPIISVK